MASQNERDENCVDDDCQRERGGGGEGEGEGEGGRKGGWRGRKEGGVEGEIGDEEHMHVHVLNMCFSFFSLFSG